MQVYIDLDGVLANFDYGYERLTNVLPSRSITGNTGQPDGDDVDWKKIVATSHFYANLPTMPDFAATWARISRYRPIDERR